MAARNTNTIPPHPNHNCSGGDADKSDGVRKTNEKTTSTDFISSLKAVILVGGAQKGMWLAGGALLSLYVLFLLLPLIILAFIVQRCPLRL